MNRQFECSFIDDDDALVKIKKVSGKTPRRAASKAFCKILKINGFNDETKGVVFFVEEKGKKYFFNGKRVPLDEPVVINVSVQNKQTGLMEEKELTYAYTDVIKVCENPLVDETESESSESDDEKNDDECIINKYIDFNEIVDNIDESIEADNKIFLMQDDNCENCVDNEIKKVNKKKINKIISMITKANDCDYEEHYEDLKIKKKIKKQMELIINKYVAYKSDEYIIFFLTLSGKDSYSGITMLGLICTETNEYVFLGCLCGHPYLATNEFTYDNSDGSGPSLIEEIKKYDVQILLKYLKKYYKEFILDKYH
jgi:hypothetical protein